MSDADRWLQFLSTRRLGKAHQDPGAPSRTDFQKDYDRVVFCSAFRRLQDKTQVFPLADSDYVRTRLTHSIESSCVGRTLGTLVGEQVCRRYDLDEVQPADFGAVVAAACLAHDIGNPPFGHAGEDAIRGWMEHSAVGWRVLQPLTEQQRLELLHFEGNAQGFRVLTRLQSPDNPGGLQLTAAVLATFTKYPRTADALVPDPGVSCKKHGFFVADLPSFAEVATVTGLAPRVPGKAWQRHPLAFLVEAADDICYRIIDLEDGFRLGHVAYDDAEHLLLPLVDRDKAARRLGMLGEPKRRVEYLRATAIGALVDAVARVFVIHEESITDGEYDRELLAETPYADALAEISEFSFDRVYAARPVLEIEAAGFEVLGGLLELFVGAVEEVAAGKQSARSRTLLKLLPDQFLGRDGRPDPDPYRRLLQVTDYVAGMTDTFAVSLFKKVRGISLPRG